jgi:hypothetical protein
MTSAARIGQRTKEMMDSQESGTGRRPRIAGRMATSSKATTPKSTVALVGPRATSGTRSFRMPSQPREGISLGASA